MRHLGPERQPQSNIILLPIKSEETAGKNTCGGYAIIFVFQY